MAVIPLKQKVIVKRKAVKDEWGEGKDVLIPHKCRFSEGAELIRRSSSSSGGPASITSEEVVGNGKFYFDKYADIKSTDELLYTDESGVQVTFVPLSIKRIRALNGKAILTAVTV